jgi:hypothetical protein
LDEPGGDVVLPARAKAIRRGVFQSVAALRNAIQRFLAAWNDQKHPFSWVKTPDQILAKANRKVISVTGH